VRGDPAAERAIGGSDHVRPVCVAPIGGGDRIDIVGGVSGPIVAV